MLVAVGGVTHAVLFLEQPVRLPFLGVDLLLKGFFWLGPRLFIVVQAYVLLHFVVLASKARGGLLLGSQPAKLFADRGFRPGSRRRCRLSRCAGPANGAPSPRPPSR